MSDQPPNLLMLRALVRRPEDGLIYRIVYVEQGANNVWLCRIDDTSWPVPFSKQMVEDPDLFIPELNDPYDRPYAIAPDPDQRPADQRHQLWWDLIAPLISEPNERRILFSAYRGKLIDERCRIASISRNTISSILKRYWKRGMRYDAVRPEYDISAGKGRQRNGREKKMGRPRTITPGIGINMDERSRRLLRIAADYRLRTKVTYQKALDHLARMHFRIATLLPDGSTEYKVSESVPTERQLKYFMAAEYPWSVQRRALVGDRRYELTERAILGAADGDIIGPGDRFIIDATVADCYLVSQFHRGRIVGRPVVYAVIDAFSRLIVGLYVGFEGPSWPGAMMALVNTVTPKVDYCRQYGVEIEPNDWPCHHAPRRIMADRGELASTRLAKSIPREGIHIENTAPYRADWKAIVERRFGIVQATFREFVPGWVEKDFGERGARDYRLESALTLPEFTGIVIRAVLEHNREPIGKFHVIPEMVAEGLAPTPNDLWDWGIKNRSGLLKVMTIDQMALAVMPRDKARVTAKGIEFKGGFYTCDGAMALDWFARARHKTWQIEVAFDPRDMGGLYAIDPALPGNVAICRPLDRSKDRAGKSLYEVEEFDHASKIVKAAGEHRRMEQRIADDQKNEEVVAQAIAATKDAIDPKASKAARIGSIRQNRADEKDARRNVEVLDLTGMRSKARPTPPPVDSALTKRDNILELLKADLEKAIGGHHDE